MTNRLDTLIQRATGLVLAACTTLALMAAIDALAAHDVTADSLLAQQHVASQPA
jgi:succinate dehydrogenase hydrophobic anchor subunit